MRWFWLHPSLPPPAKYDTDAVSVQAVAVWSLMDLQVVCGTMGMPTATVKLRGPDGMARISSAVGTGPVDASYKAIDSLVRVDAALVDYTVSAVTAGIEALATTRVREQDLAYSVCRHT